MKKNDKLIVLLGVAILVMASIGVYYWAYEEGGPTTLSADKLVGISGTFSEDLPDAITVSDTDPFYALIATPLAVHYDSDGGQEIIPLYVKNFENPSRAVKQAQSMIGKTIDLIVDGSKSPEEISLELAKQYWEKSDAVLLIEDSQEGYNLGVIATPIASYLSIPIIVTDEVDVEILSFLRELGVEYSLVCGNLSGIGFTLKFENVEEIVDAEIELLLEKFGDIDYITLTNPIDAWPPKVLDTEEYTFGPVTLESKSATRLVHSVLKGGEKHIGSFTIPKDYKYALVKFEGINLDSEDVDELGDMVSFQVGANLPDIPKPLQSYEIFKGSTSRAGVPIRDAAGNVITDRAYVEVVLYDRGGVEYDIKAGGIWLVKEKGDVLANVVIEKLEHPIYPMMKGLSSLAPYLTAYHKGIIFGKPEFAFTADDDVVDNNGETCPGFYMPRRNPKLTESFNQHIFDKIHDPLNNLLAKLAYIDLEGHSDLKSLREYYKAKPIYIALVGGATVLPQYTYQNYMEPVGAEEIGAWWAWGGGTPSDVIYGNIDPVRYDWSNLADDIYSDYPYQENIVGRITGWDVQDANALIVRTVFYDDIIAALDDSWKDSFALVMGAGQDFQKPPLRYLLFGDKGPHKEPMKLPTGYGKIAGERTVEQLAKPLGFTVQEAWDEEAMIQGFSDDALQRIKWETALLSKFSFFPRYVKQLVGEGVVKGGKTVETSNFIFFNAHGNRAYFGTGGFKLSAAGLGGPVAHWMLQQALQTVSKNFGPGSSMEQIGDYSTRNVEILDFGPSFMWLESCICGKIDGMYPQNSVGQALLHAGVTSLIASPTGSNIAGGYLEPKNQLRDTPLSVLRAYLKATKDAKNGIYPEPHFGFRIYTDLCEYLKENDASIGLAFREAKNRYLPQDADWELWWSPPLVTTGDHLLDSELTKTYAETMKSMAGQDPMLKNKYTSFQEYLLFGDPAFNPYEPCNEGK